MEKKRKLYMAPDIEVTRVEIESSICSGSADIQNPDNEQGRISDQNKNTDFSSNAFGGGTWDEPKN